MNKSYFAFIAALILAGSVHAEQTAVKLLFVGDLMVDELPGQLIKQGKNPFAAFETQFSQADLRFGNLECSVGNAGKREIKPFTFQAHPRVLSTIKQHFNAVSLANNHTGDYGPAAFGKMMDLLEQKGIPYFGGGRDVRAAHAPYVSEVKGVRIAILAYDDFFPRSFEALEDRPGVAWADDDQIVFDIRAAKTTHKADIVIVYPHWGWEHEKMASPRQIQLAHLMIEAGADAVVGGHPHVTQNIEIYQNKPIFYSLGNFIFNGFHTEDSQTGWALELMVDKDKKMEWKIHVAKLDKNGIPQYAGVLPAIEVAKLISQ
ncbi:MAG: CapA family protein [Burkholderiales bacterium]|nr:CapA family protein [Burkholderiales bacterium]